MSSDIEFGVMANNIGTADTVNDELYDAIARTSQALEYDIIHVPDHIVLPEDLHESEYPFSPSGDAPFNIDDHIHDQFTVLAYLASQLDTVKLGTNICIAPLRHPLDLLRQVTSINSLNAAGIELGVGAGWSEEEYDALDVPFGERGQRLDEFLEIVDTASEDPKFSYNGEHYSFQTVSCYPDLGGGIPVMIGGYSGATFRRIAQFGDGWTAAWARPDEIASSRERIMNAWDDFDRKGDPDISITRPVDPNPDTSRDTSRPFVGDPAQMIEDIERYIDVGVTRINIDYYDRTAEAIPRTIERFGKEVLPSFK
jgi:probable F420-dependent oxidoreductase